MQELDVVGVRVELPAKQPIVLLKETDGERYLPIWIGATEAAAIAFAQHGVVSRRPLTHDLFRDVLEALERPLSAVHITGMTDGVFYAELVFEGGPTVSARPSDAIALAVRMSTPVLVADDLLDSAGIAIHGDPDDEVERFREFLDQVSPEDFEQEGPPA